MSFSWFVARRYLTARRRQAFISLISAVSILGVGVGVMAVIIALALMTGAQGQMRDNIVGATAHVYVYKQDGLIEDPASERQRVLIPGVSGAAPATFGYVLFNNGAVSEPVQLKGIDPALEPEVTDIRNSMETGSLNALSNRSPDELDAVILGTDLARALGVSVGDEVRVASGAMQSTPMGPGPKQRRLEVVGTFNFGFYEVDTRQALVSLETASDLLPQGGPDMMQLRLADMDDARRVRDELSERLGIGYRVQDWMEINQTLYSALWLEKVAISLTIGLIVMVAALNIVASLILLVMEKTRDIAILRTMGTQAGTIRRIFMYQGLTIGLIGTLGGTVLGVVVSFVLDRYRLIKMPEDVYQISYLPFRVQPLDVAVVVAAALGICLVATLYPSRQAARIDPAEALRNQ